MKKTASIACMFFTILLPTGFVYGQSGVGAIQNSVMNEPIVAEAIIPQNIYKKAEDSEPARKCLIQWASRCSTEPTDPKIIKFMNSPQPSFEIMQAIPPAENHLRPLLDREDGMAWFIAWTKELVSYSRSLPRDASILNQMYKTTAADYLAQYKQFAQLRKTLPYLPTGQEYVVDEYGNSVFVQTGDNKRAQAELAIKDILGSLPETTMELLVLQTKCRQLGIK